MREEFWVGGWSTVGASLASPLLIDATSLEGTRLTVRVVRGEPVTAQVPNRWAQGPPGLFAIRPHGPERVRSRNFVVR